MAIDTIGKLINAPSIKPTKTVADNNQKVPNAATQKSDSVVFSSTAIELSKTQGKSTPVDNDKVGAVKKAIADGTYSINADKVSLKMIQMERLMPQ